MSSTTPSDPPAAAAPADATSVPVSATPIETQDSTETDTPTSTQPTEQDQSTPESPATQTPAKPDLDLPLSAANGLIQKPFLQPLESSKPLPPAQLTADQQTKYKTVLDAVSEWETVPTTAAKNAPTAPITDDERMFLTRECLLRYLRATKWDTTEAVARLQRTLTWRREYGIEKLTPDYISVENETGKQVILGFDIHTRPCLYLLPSKQNTERSERQIQHLVFMLERLVDILGPDQETIALIVNFKETKSGQNSSLSQARETLNFLQNHYPERLGRALVINTPFVILGFFKLITPFIDPLTREKLRFNEDLSKHVPPSQLMKAVGGDVEFQYDHATYWPALNELAQQKRTQQQERWVQGGKRIGEYEHYLKTGVSPSLSQREGAADTANGVTDTAQPEA